MKKDTVMTIIGLAICGIIFFLLVASYYYDNRIEETHINRYEIIHMDVVKGRSDIDYLISIRNSDDSTVLEVNAETYSKYNTEEVVMVEVKIDGLNNKEYLILKLDK